MTLFKCKTCKTLRQLACPDQSRHQPIKTPEKSKEQIENEKELEAFYYDLSRYMTQDNEWVRHHIKSLHEAENIIDDLIRREISKSLYALNHRLNKLKRQ